MTSHDEIRNEIPAYVVGRLEPERRREVEAHFESCPSCGELIEGFREIAGALREGGEALFEEHPDDLALRDHALGRTGGDDESLRRHLDSCATCELLAEGWRRDPDGPLPHAARPVRAPVASGWRPMLLPAGLALALGLLLGLALDSFVRSGPARPATHEVTGHAGELIVIRVRRGQPESDVYTISTDTTEVTVLLQVDLPSTLDDAEACSFEIRRGDGELVWSATDTVGRLRELIARSEVAVYTAPTKDLHSGSYELSLVLAARPDRETVLRVPVEIRRQPGPD